MNKKELLVIGGITLVGLFLLREQSQEPGEEGRSIFPQPEPRISPIYPQPEPLISPPPEPMTKKSVQPLPFSLPPIEIPPPPPPPSLPTTSGSNGGSSSGGGDSKNIMPIVMVPDLSPKTIRKHIIVPFGGEFTGGEVPTLKKKDINIPPPPGLTMVSSMADALTKAITGALKKKELKKKD